MNWKQEYEKWISFEGLDHELKNLLQEMKSDESALSDSFYKTLEFGTGGMRGEIGAGPNRMNVYTVRKASEGLARFIEANGEEAKAEGVVIAYDSRFKSPEFAMEAALTLGFHGIKVYLFDELRPTPELSFAVRHLHAYAGIVITASHNPSEYNGYKVYGNDGGQLPPEAADELVRYVASVESELEIPVALESELLKSDLLQMIGKELDDAYMEKVKTITADAELIQEMGDQLEIVFSPLHGTSNMLVRRGLAELGYQNVTLVKEQAEPDPNFSTVRSPNPEEHDAFTLAIAYGEKVNADLLMATDPDADRLGVAVKNSEGSYAVLTGNQTGALMLDYLLTKKKEMGTLPSNGVVLKTIVTSEIGRVIAEQYGIETVDTLTGFKFIGEKIKEYKESGEKTFLFGYEESYGYLIGDFVRDKDAIQSALLICEVAAYYKKHGKSLYDGLLDIYEKYGFFLEDLHSITLKGKTGAEKIQEIMSSFREGKESEIAGIGIDYIEDYQSSSRRFAENGRDEKILLPSSNVLKYVLMDGSWFCLRPSGTEPKIKFYFGVQGITMEESKTKLENIKRVILQKIE